MAVKLSGHKSVKHQIIEKSNNRMIIAVSVAVFVFVFSLFAMKALIDQANYQQRVISKKRDTLQTLKANVVEADLLRESYVSFVSEQVNVLGGNPTGSGPRDGDNAKLVLDSLPPELDFPGLSSSIEKILTDGGYAIQSIGGGDSGLSGTDSTASIQTDSVIGSGPVSPVEIAFPFSVSASTESALSLLQTLELSIRPFNLSSLTIQGSSGGLEMTINMNTYYQPRSALQVTTEVVR